MRVVAWILTRAAVQWQVYILYMLGVSKPGLLAPTSGCRVCPGSRALSVFLFAVVLPHICWMIAQSTMFHCVHYCVLWNTALLCVVVYSTTVCSDVLHYYVQWWTALLSYLIVMKSCCTWHAWYISYIYIYMTWQSITQSCICNVVAGCSCTC